MELDRRHFVSLAAAGAAGTLLPTAFSSARAATPGAEQFFDHFAGKGAAVLDPLPLVTGNGFNGGLRYDDTRAIYPEGTSVCVQPSCRIEDAVKAGEPGVLALFHIAVLNLPASAGAREAITHLMRFAVETEKLNPEKFVFVSTEVFEPHFTSDPLLQKGRFVKRDLEEARAAGDGSGFFSPDGHPDTNGFNSVSIHFPIGGGSEGTLAYPLAGFLEIGEISLAEAGSGTGGTVGGGFGLERLALASGRQAPDYAQSRASLFDLAQQETASSGNALPEGLKAFAD
ncbi:MAG: hypothetical protein AAFN16_09515 [Pseudomonadota bacterium]